LPRLLRRLVLETAKDLSALDFPAAEGDGPLGAGTGSRAPAARQRTSRVDSRSERFRDQPRTAAILRKLAADYEADTRREDQEAERQPRSFSITT
jgi:hypothetical protein